MKKYYMDFHPEVKSPDELYKMAIYKFWGRLTELITGDKPE